MIFIRATSDYDKDRRRTDLMMVNVRTKQLRQLTYGRRGISQPRWSPDGSRIAFIAPDTADERPEPHDQIFVMRLDGGDPKPVTHSEQGIDGFAWSPAGTQFAYIAQDKNPNAKQIEAHLDAFEVGSNDYLHREAAIPSHLWLVSANGGRARRLTSGSWSLATVDPYQTSDISWSADGRMIAVQRFPTPYIGDSLASRIVLIDPASRRLTPLTRNGNMEADPLFAPSGSAIAYARNTNGDAMNGVAVYVTKPGAARSRDVRAAIDRNIVAKTWSGDGRALWLFGEDGARNTIWYVLPGGQYRRVDLGGLSPNVSGNASQKTDALVFAATMANHPSELYLLSSPSSALVRLTNLNGAVSKLQLARMTSVRWKNDGFEEDGVVVLPPSFDSLRKTGRRFPLVLLIHGGPQGASTIGWNSQAQLFASHGYIVFEPNYRGSTNLGDRYQHAIARDTGDGPGRDVMAGIAAVKRAYPIDSGKIAVSGWSYGGFMTSWMIGHYGGWRAAVSGAALNDWFDDYNDAFYVYTDIPFFGGSPWDPRYTAMWRAQSPITYAQRIRTPTLIMGDIGDNNVTITNSFKMYHALKDNGVTVQFVAYPVHGHFPGDPVRSEDVTRRWLAWLDRYLQ